MESYLMKFAEKDFNTEMVFSYARTNAWQASLLAGYRIIIIIIIIINLVLEK